MKFTKSEQTLLAEAAKSPSKIVGVDWGYQGPSGQKRPFGLRRHSAAVSLMRRGLFERVSSDNGSPLYSGNGEGQNGIVYSSTWKLVGLTNA